MVVDGKSVAGAGTTAMSIIALAGVVVDYLTKNNVNLFGGGGATAAALAAAEAKIARLESEKYTDAATMASNQRISALESQIAALTANTFNLQTVVGGVTKYGVPASAIIGSTTTTAGA